MLTDLDNPYKGLRAFTEADADDFFGREALIHQLLIRLGEGGDLTDDQRHVVLYGSDRLRIPYGKHPLSSRLRWSGITARMMKTRGTIA